MKQAIKVLMAEDEDALGMIVKESLESRDFEVHLVQNGEEALNLYSKEVFDIIVLDVMMPKVDGFTVAKSIRKVNELIPIIFLTAKSQTADVIEGFSYGANDYLKKPFSMEELIVRMKALLSRKRKPQLVEQVQIGQFTFHIQRQVLITANQDITLTSREAQLLEQLFLHKNELLDRSYILNQLWGSDDFFNARSMDVFISKLRKKLSADSSIQIINVRGFGYKLVC